MDNSYFYTKGSKEDVVTRIGQVHTITMYCPLDDLYVRTLRDTFKLMLPEYNTEENLWFEVPSVEALRVFMVTAQLKSEMNIDIDNGIMGIIVNALKMFTRLKLISFKFVDDEDIMNTYKKVLNNEKPQSVTVINKIYKLDMIEMNLNDMFSQGIIDMVNKVFMCNELIPNSYLNRRFVMDFNYDDYTSFMDMFIENNRENLNVLDKNICDYFRKFPKLIDEQKPTIRIITNYSEM